MVLAGCGKEEVEDAISRTSRPAMKRLARLGAGFLVWERYHDGGWELWRKNLDGTGERRLLPRERGRDHFCPKISPNGKYVAFLSYPQGTNAYTPGGKTGVLWLVNAVTRKRVLLAMEARSYAEDRAVVWFDNDSLCYIDSAGYAVEIDVETKAARRITKAADPDFGWLVNARRTHATTGTPEFAPYSGETGEVDFQNRHAGCQPYFTRNGLWGYWMGGGGGPLNRMRLSNRVITPILKREDSRLGEWHYVYFPMISPCGRLLAWGASKGEHDHFKADYEIFAARIHPDTLELIGPPVRYTDFAGTDRFPDIFSQPLALGSHFVEGRAQVHFEVPEGGDWDWQMDGKDRGTGAEFLADIDEEGDHWVRASKGRRKLLGLVHVSKPEPPRLLAVRREGDALLWLHFNEPLQGSDLQINANGPQGPPLRWRLLNDHVTLEIELGIAGQEVKQVHVSGLRDRAQRPSVWPAQSVHVPGQRWPSEEDGLVFVWKDRKEPNRLADGTLCTVEPRGKVFWTRHDAMKFGGGSFEAPNAGKRITQRTRATGEFTAEFMVRPQVLEDDPEFREMIDLVDGGGVHYLTLGQKQGQLVMILGTEDNRDPGKQREVPVCMLKSGERHHVLVGYRARKLMVMIDGEFTNVRHRLTGDMAHWGEARLVFGAGRDGEHPWYGAIEGVAFYDRLITEDQALEHFAAAEALMGARGRAPEWRVRARLVEASRVPSLEEIQPYKEALVRHRWEVLAAESGAPIDAKEIVVTHWAWMGGQRMDSHDLKPGVEAELLLESYEDQTQVHQLVTRDDLTDGFDAPQFLDVGWSREPALRQGEQGPEQQP